MHIGNTFSRALYVSAEGSSSILAFLGGITVGSGVTVICMHLASLGVNISGIGIVECSCPAAALTRTVMALVHEAIQLLVERTP